jgi:20S proteasome alpha/beta subunit
MMFPERGLISAEEQRPMTIVVGLVAKDGIVIAADSQAQAYRGAPFKRSDYTKIYEMGEQKDDVKAALAGAGATAFISKAVAEITDIWHEERITTVTKFEEVIEATMLSLAKKYFFDRQRSLGTDEGVQVKPRRAEMGYPIMVPDLSLLCAAIDRSGGKYLATIGASGLAERENSYTSIGSGSAYAEYILARLYTEELSIEEALDCAVYTVEEVKDIDPNCGGPVHAVSVTQEGTRCHQQDELKPLVAKLNIRDELLAKIWRAMILGEKSSEDVTKFLSS